MAKTALQLITDALYQTSIIPEENDAVPSYMMNRGLVLLNDIIDEWGSDTGLIPYQTILEFDMVPGQDEYTVGLGNEYDINSNQILRILAFNFDVYSSDSANPITYQLEEMNEPENANIVYRGVATYPSRFLLRSFPKYSSIIVQNKPNSAFPCKLVCKQRINPVSLYENLEDQFPPGFLLAIKYQLMQDIKDAYGQDVDQSLSTKASKALKNVRGNNKLDLYIRKTETLRGSSWYRGWFTNGSSANGQY